MIMLESTRCPCFRSSVSSSSQNVVQMSVHLASTLLDVMVSFLERAMREGLRPDILELLGSSFLYSTLLPTTLAQLGPVACRQPKVHVVTQMLALMQLYTKGSCLDYPNLLHS